MSENEDIQFETYVPLDREGNIMKAVRNLRKAYWSNDTERVAKVFTDAEDMIIIAIAFGDYTVTKEQEHE